METKKKFLNYPKIIDDFQFVTERIDKFVDFIVLTLNLNYIPNILEYFEWLTINRSIGIYHYNLYNCFEPKIFFVGETSEM